MQPLLFLFLAVIAVGALACGDDNTELMWTNQTGNQIVSDIRWIPYNGNSDTSFSAVLTADGQTTEAKEISENSRYGSGEALLNHSGSPADIITPEGKDLNLASGQTNNYDIDQVVAKK